MPLAFKKKQEKPHPIRDTLFFALLMVIFALAGRVYLVEAFSIPTGSMAPTLLGAHRHVICAQCQHAFDVDIRGESAIFCPLCHEKILETSEPLLGDRVLISKTLSRPRRFDVVVFRCPQEHDPVIPFSDAPGPNSFFCKRVVGLPGEDVYLLDGHVFVRKAGEKEFTIARRADINENSNWEKISRHVWRPLMHKERSGGELTLDLDAEKNNERSAYDKTSLHPYNQPTQGWKHRTNEVVEDVRLMAQTQTLHGRMGLSTRFKGAEKLTLAWDGSKFKLLGNDDALIRQEAIQLSTGDTIEFWLLDHEALAFINHRCVLRHAFDVPWEEMMVPCIWPSYPSIYFAGEFKNMTIDCATPYLSRIDNNIAKGGLTRDASGHVIMNAPAILPDGTNDAQACFYCLGDNSPASIDSRFLKTIHPDVQTRLLGGHAFEGVVPENLMVGKVLFVAWPADESGVLWKPQFSKIRWVH